MGGIGVTIISGAGQVVGAISMDGVAQARAMCGWATHGRGWRK